MRSEIFSVSVSIALSVGFLGSSIALYQSSIENRKLISQREMILSKVKAHELDQLSADSAWFKVGCETAIDSIVEGEIDEQKSADVKLAFMPIRLACGQTAESVQGELLKRYEAGKHDGPGEQKGDSVAE